MFGAESHGMPDVSAVDGGGRGGYKHLPLLELCQTRPNKNLGVEWTTRRLHIYLDW